MVQYLLKNYTNCPTMKLLLRNSITSLLCLMVLAVSGQCPGGYTTASINWDNLDFLQQDPTYISASAAQNQYFAIGTNKLTITHNYATSVAVGETLNQTGKTGSYAAGADVEFSGNGTITLSFSSPVYNLKFSVQDVEKGQTMSVTAFDGVTPRTTTLSTCAAAGTTFLTLLANPSNNPSVRSLDAKNVGVVDNTTNLGSFNVDVAGPVTTVTFVVTVINGGYSGGSVGSGGNPDFFLSDISACINTPAFPNSYYAISQPFTNQPGYVLTALNDSVFYVNPANGNAQLLFRDPTGNNINSMGYDPYNKFLYYTYSLTNGGAVNPNDKSIQKYDVNTGVISTVVSNVNTLGIPTYTSGVESGGAAFYNGSFYIGIEGIDGDESKVWRIDFDGAFNPIVPAHQVFSLPTVDHDWGDFAIYNGTLYDFDGKTSSQENAQHYNMQTGATTNLYSSPGLTFIPRQVSIDWMGNVYNVGTAATSSSGTIVPYTNGTINTAQQYTITRNGVAVSGSWGDAAEAFRPRVDFGDAPATYDPNPLAPALHETSSTLRLGTAQDVEWAKTSSVNADADGGDEDGLPFLQVLTSGGNYYTDVDVYNNTGANATVCGWIDFNANGIFDPGEGVSQTVPSSAVTQRIQLFWPSVVTTLLPNSYTYIRVRVTSAANAMTTANATGFFSNGEVEDYYVIVNAVALNVKLNKFSAVKLNDESVKLNWSVNGEEAGTEYQVDRSDNGASWQTIHRRTATKDDVAVSYSAQDELPAKPASYYRLKYTDIRNKIHYSQIEKIQFPVVRSYTLYPNPASNYTTIIVDAVVQSSAQVQLIDANGKLVHSQNLTLQKGNNNIPVVFPSKLSNGTHVVQLITEEKTYSQKIIINN